MKYINYHEINHSVPISFSFICRMEKRMLSLIFLAHASDVLENAFAPLNDDDYDLAMKHVRFLLDSDLENEAARQGANEVMWAVFAAFIK